jgi:PAS domain S-box-containing protein
VLRIVETTIGLTALLGLLIGLFSRGLLHRVSDSYVTTLKAVESRSEELYNSRQSYYTTLQSIGDAVIVCDAEGRVNFMNQVAQDLCGMNQVEADGQPLAKVFNIVNETTRATVENPVDKVRRLDRVVGLANHTVLLRPDGTEINIDDSGAPIRDQHGELTGVVLVFRDITQSRKTAQALLASEKLAVAGRLSATIAHEIHNPLDSVANLLYLLRNNPSPEDAEKYLQLATQELKRVTETSRTMLSLYREPKAPILLDLKDLLESVLVLLDRKLQDARIRLTLELPEGVRVEGFPAELRQVFTNLLTNAVEAAGRDGSVTVALRARDDNSGAIIEVSDNGPGIPERCSLRSLRRSSRPRASKALGWAYG